MRTAVPTPTLLVIGPDAVWAPFQAALQQAGFTVIHTDTETVAPAQWDPDAILVAHPPDEDLLLWICQLRLETVAPLLLLLPCGDEAFILKAYEVGADDVLPLSISPPLLVAKVHAWVCRARGIPLSTLPPRTGQGLTLDPQTRTAFLPGGQAVRLTVLEFRLLYALMAHRGQPVRVERLLRWVWGYREGDSDLLKRLVYRLRQKLEPDPTAPCFIRTVRGVGYAFGPEEGAIPGVSGPEKLGPI